MPDDIFDHPKLAAIYDCFDGKRGDLDHYLDIVKELGASSVLDVGCGTGSFSVMLAEHGITVTGVDPAGASLDIAREKPFADRVKWILGDAPTLPDMRANLAVMTGNVAQVFLTDMAWSDTLSGIRGALSPEGYFVFEVRDPAQKAWEMWTKDKTYQRLNVPGIGYVAGWCEITDVSGEFVSFCWSYYFEDSDETLSSHSTLRFRPKDDIAASLDQAGFQVMDIRDAPDRPDQEFVFIAQLRP